jgi:phosphoribosylformylglycinamidine (FGAM) synthase-like amidotransferase family enzyme
MDKTTKTAVLSACAVVIAAGGFYLWDHLSFDWRVNACVRQVIKSDLQNYHGLAMQAEICANRLRR